ncbi:MAG: NADH:ubiquinone oxidoreductase [Candidatus Latescibacterota bacterium]|nr:MAG: NADH:ubiquinone oxidoreductase [Candidatus Latescibacterota bacterium]
MSKPKIGVFSFASCEGCQLQILSIENELLDLLGRVEIVNFREAIDDKRNDYDIAFVEGSIVTETDAEEVREIRSHAGLLVTIGACAVTTGLNGMRNATERGTAWKRVYPDRELDPNVAPEVRRVSEVVKVDFEIPGCPIDRKELLYVVATLLQGQVPRLPTAPVCDECRRAGNPCLLDRGLYCFGSIARAGCEAICPSYGESCCGCRGLLEGAPIEELIEILGGKGYPREEVVVRLNQFNSRDEKVKALTEEQSRHRKEAAA